MTPQTDPRNPSVRVAALDGLRGLSALLVVLAHITTHLPVAPYPTGGNVGVIAFFVLSGYLIGGQCWDRGMQPAWYRKFLRRRAVRLLPATTVLAVLVSLMLLGQGLVPGGDLLAASAATLTQTMGLAWASGLPEVPPLSPTWSLTSEWVFYLSAPLVMRAIRNRVPPQGAVRPLAAMAAGLYVLGLPLGGKAFYLLPLANLAPLWLGAALAVWQRTQPTLRTTAPWGAGGLFLIVALGLLPGHALDPAYRWVLFPATALATAGVIHAVFGSKAPAHALTRFALPTLGRRAYSLYLWHMPLLWFVGTTLQSMSPWLQLFVFLSALPFVVQLAYLTTERPLLNGRVEQTRPVIGNSP